MKSKDGRWSGVERQEKRVQLEVVVERDEDEMEKMRG